MTANSQLPPPRSSSPRDAPEVLRRVAEGADPALVHELLTFTRCLFVAGDHGFADCPPGIVTAFLDPALGLELEVVRRRMFARLFGLVPNPAFDVGHAQAAPRRLGRRALLAELRRRSAARRATITQAEVIRAERRVLPYYAAVREAFGAWAPVTVHHEPVLAHVVPFLAARPSPRVIDIGCGFGQLMQKIRERVPSARVVGTDLTPDGAHVLAAHHASPFADASFDAVVSTCVPEMLVDPPTLAAECARLVKPDGLVVVTTATSHTLHLSRNPLTYLEGFASTLVPALLPRHHGLLEPLTPLPTTWRFFTRHEMRAMYAAHFSDVRVTTFHYAHLRKFGLERLAPGLPLLRHFGGNLLVGARGPR